MKRLLLIGSAIAALAFGSVAAYATSVTVSPWAYACGHTDHGNPVTRADTPDEHGCPADDAAGTATASYSEGTLTLSKLCPSQAVTLAKCTTDNMSAGATIGGLTTLTAASWDLGTGSYCGAGAPRLNVVTTDGKTHFFGCAANKTLSHVSINFTAAGDGSGNGGIVGKNVTSIDFVQDEAGTAILRNLSFTGTAVVTVVPVLPHAGGGTPVWPLGVLLVVIGLAILTIRRRTA